jgi:2-oxoglutarate ferredoxin oxidoreductase subunit delta
MSPDKMGQLPVEINLKWCKACGICYALCPKKVLAGDEWGKAYVAHPEDCIKCQTCEIMCPDLAVKVVAARKPKKEDE